MLLLLLQLLHVRRSLVAPVTSSSTLARHRVLNVRMGGREPVLNRHGHRVLWRQGRRHHQDSLPRERRCRGSGRYPRGNVVPVQSVHRPTVHSKLSLGKKSLAKFFVRKFSQEAENRHIGQVLLSSFTHQEQFRQILVQERFRRFFTVLA